MLLSIHILTVVISISGFIFRGILRFRHSGLANARWLKILPHVNDTILLVSALLLLNQAGFSLLHTAWLQAKIIALFAYIILGFIAFRLGESEGVRLAAWLTAILVFSYIVGVALTKNPLLFL